ncbi:hypothetical protein D3C76_1635460 [compost metagenome]
MATDVAAVGIDPQRLVLLTHQPTFLRFRPGDQFGHAQTERAGKPPQQHRRWATVAAFNFVHHRA